MRNKKKQKQYSCEDIAEYRHRTYNTIDTYNKIGIVRSIAGVTLLYGGLVTFPLPTGSFIAVGLGCWLLGYDSKVIIKKAKYKLKLLYNWIYCNRTPKRIIRTLKSRVLL